MTQPQPTCRYCGQPFEPRRYWQDFDSPECRRDWHERERKLAAEARKKELAKRGMK